MYGIECWSAWGMWIESGSEFASYEDASARARELFLETGFSYRVVAS